MAFNRLSTSLFLSNRAPLYCKNLYSTTQRTFHSSISSKMVALLKSSDEFRAIIKEDKYVFIDFYATWCGPCKAVSPLVEKLSEAYKEKMDFYKVDVDELADVASECAVRAMPTFMIFKNGEKVKELVGANPGALRSMVDDVSK
ncbi:thioredoxin-like protein [Dipodascopsis uninucleata]